MAADDAGRHDPTERDNLAPTARPRRLQLRAATGCEGESACTAT